MVRRTKLDERGPEGNDFVGFVERDVGNRIRDWDAVLQTNGRKTAYHESGKDIFNNAQCADECMRAGRRR